MPKLGRSYTVDVLVPENGEGEFIAKPPDGFRLVANGRGAVRITARDRDKIGSPVSIDHLLLVIDPAYHERDMWPEAFRHALDEAPLNPKAKPAPA